jgi:hypothetical protein
MLPPSWKGEVNKAIDEATARYTDAQGRTSEQNREIAAGIEALTGELKRYNFKQETEEPRKRTRENFTMAGLIATAIFTFALAGFSLWQALEIRWAYDPIKQQADAAFASLQYLLETEQPVIKIDDIEIKGIPGNPQLTYRLKNEGKRTARGWRIQFCILINPGGLDIPPEPPPRPPAVCVGADISAVILPFGATYSSDQDRPFKFTAVTTTNDDATATSIIPSIKSKPKSIYVFGGIAYLDTLDEAMIHQQDFCFSYKAELIPRHRPFGGGPDWCYARKTYKK